MKFVSRRTLAAYAYPCRERRKYILSGCLGTLVVVLGLLNWRYIVLHGDSKLLSILNFQFQILLIFYLCMLVPILNTDCAFIHRAVRMSKGKQFAELWKIMSHCRGARLHWLLLSRPLTCFFVAAVLDSAADLQDDHKLKKIAEGMRLAAIKTDSSLKEIVFSADALAVQFETDLLKLSTAKILLSRWKLVLVVLSLEVVLRNLSAY